MNILINRLSDMDIFLIFKIKKGEKSIQENRNKTILHLQNNKAILRRIFKFE